MIENELVIFRCFGNVALAELVPIEVREIRERKIAVKTFVIIIATFKLPLVSWRESVLPIRASTSSELITTHGSTDSTNIGGR